MPSINGLKRYKTVFLLSIIFCLALSIRLYKLDTIPKGVLDDEASYGYIAYSILHTGKDERGVSMPLHFKAFGDEKLPGYAYILVPIVNIFGLNNFSTRLPSAFAGSLLVLAVFAMLRALRIAREQSLFGSLMVSISPWTIVLSRFAFESNLALLLFVVGLWSLFSSLQSKRQVYVVITIFFFACTWYMYIPYRFITIVLLFIYLILIYKEKIVTKKYILGLSLFALVLVAPLLPHTFSKSGTARLDQVGLFNSTGIVHTINDRRGYCGQYVPHPICVLLANKPITIATQVISNQIRSFSPEFLFLSAEKDILYLSVADYGVLPVVLLPFFVAGVLVLLTNQIRRSKNSVLLFILLALFVTTLPSALVGPPQRVRLSALLPFLIIIISMGYYHMVSIFKNRSTQLLLSIITWSITLIVGCTFIIDLFFIHIPKLKIDYESDIPAVMKYIHTHANHTDVYFDKFNNNFPMLYAYHNAINPVDYHAYAKYSSIDSGGFTHPIGYKNLMKPNKPLGALICEKSQKSEQFFFVTNEAVQDMGTGPEIPVYTELSGDRNSIVSYIYLIDSTKYYKQCAKE